MPKRKDKAPEAKTVKVRLTLDVLKRVDEARLGSYHKVDAESKFLGYLVELGLNKYEKIIHPLEMGEDVEVFEGKKESPAKMETDIQKKAVS